MASVDDSKKWMSWRFPRRQGDDNPDGRKEPENDDDDEDLGDLSNQKKLRGYDQKPGSQKREKLKVDGSDDGQSFDYRLTPCMAVIDPPEFGKSISGQYELQQFIYVAVTNFKVQLLHSIKKSHRCELPL